MLDRFALLSNLPTTDPGLGYARRTSAASAQLRKDLSGLGSISVPPGYPANSTFGARLAGLAAMLSAGLPMRCVALDAPGVYDTHANQEASLPADLARCPRRSTPSSATSSSEVSTAAS